MKVALFQMNIIWENKNENLRKLEDTLETLGKKNVDLILMPETSLTGFSMNTDLTGEDNFETVEKIKKLATKYGVAIGVGWTKRLGNKANNASSVKQENDKSMTQALCENHYSIVGPDAVDGYDGADNPDVLDVPMLLDYAKIHPFSYSGEDKYFVGGDYQDFLYFKDFNISTAICYDLRFPEIFQAMSKKADMIIVPANWPAARLEHWNKLLMARAIENQCYIAGVNCVGDIDGTNYAGGTKMINPQGDVMIPDELIGYENDEAVFIYNLKNDVEKIREAFPVKKDRRDDLYISFLRG